MEFLPEEFSSGSRLSANGIPAGTVETKAEDNGGNDPALRAEAGHLLTVGRSVARSLHRSSANRTVSI